MVRSTNGIFYAVVEFFQKQFTKQEDIAAFTMLEELPRITSNEQK